MDRSIESYIEGAEEVSNFFGKLPSFHDAEVVEMNLWRGRIYPGVVGRARFGVRFGGAVRRVGYREG